MIHAAGKYGFIFSVYFVLSFVCISLSIAQLTMPGSPASEKTTFPVYEINYQKEKIRKNAETSGDPMLKPARSGILIDTMFIPGIHGHWDTLSNGLKIWRAGFYIRDAQRVSFIFKPFRLEEGAKVFMYDPARRSVLGAFSYLNNKTINLLAAGQIKSDTIIVEMQVPAWLKYYGDFGITGIGCEFQESTLKSVNDEYYGDSGPCNVDIQCISDSLIAEVKRSVVRIVYDGTERCTGTLMNTTRKNGFNYILTAGHCFTEESYANTALFFFDYESPFCDGPDNNTLKSLSGATIRATSESLDFALLELFEPIPFTYRPYYAGWDNTAEALPAAYTIHHPFGDVKKISIENHSVTVSSYSGYDRKTHWLVNHWEKGTTEPGSSGAPLFDNSGRVTGTLTGGIANCESSVKDYFQMLNHDWNDYSEPGNQLAVWLDPLVSGTEKLHGYDPYSTFWQTGDTISHIQQGEQLKLEKGPLAWGSYSGHNSDHLDGFAEHFNTLSNKYITGLILHVAKNYIAIPNALIKVKIWRGTAAPEEVIYEKNFSLARFIGNQSQFFEFDSAVYAGKNFFAGYELQYRIKQDTFSIFMGSGSNGGNVTAYIRKENAWQSLSQYTSGLVNSSFAVYPVVYDSVPDQTEIVEIKEDLVVYPNPASKVIWLFFKNTIRSTYEINLYSIHGYKIRSIICEGYQNLMPVNVADLTPGIYIIRVKRENKTYTRKITVFK